MGQNGPEFADAYLTTLQEHLVRAGEGPLLQAFDLGRTAFTRGLGVVDIAVVHHESLAAILGRLPTLEEHIQATRKASEIQAESLSVYEMALLGYRDANAELTRLNQELNQQAAELEKLAATERQARLELERDSPRAQAAPRVNWSTRPSWRRWASWWRAWPTRSTIPWPSSRTISP